MEGHPAICQSQVIFAHVVVLVNEAQSQVSGNGELGGEELALLPASGHRDVNNFKRVF